MTNPPYTITQQVTMSCRTIFTFFAFPVLLAITSLHAQDAAPSALLYTDRPILPQNFERENVDALKKSVAEVMAMSDDALMALVPAQTPLLKVACPHCRKGLPYDVAWDGVLIGKFMNYAWDPKKPEAIQCKDCERVYPGNKEYPMTHKEVMLNEDGRAIEVPYYFDPNKVSPRGKYAKNELGRKYYLQGAVDYAKWTWLWPKTEQLAKLYHITGEEQYAYKAVLILWRYARNYNDFLFTECARTYVTTEDFPYPYGHMTTRAGSLGNSEIMEKVYKIVDLVYASESVEKINQKIGRDVRDDMWPMFERGIMRMFAKGYDNLVRPHVGLFLLELAQIFDRVDLAHFATQMILDYPYFRFSPDGHFGGGTGYHQVQAVIAGLLREVDPITDPKGYTGTDRIDKVSHWYGREQFWRDLFVDARRQICYPDGNVPIAGDTSVFPDIWGAYGPREKSDNVMRPNYKYVVLGDGKRENQIQVHTKFGNNDGGHSHTDTLNFQLFAHGHLLNDALARSGGVLGGMVGLSMFKNNVVVDHTNQSRMKSEGNPLIFESSLPGLSVISADAPLIYEAQDVSKYKRTLALNTVDIKKPYVVDVFQIKGGKRHDFILKSPTYFVSSASTDLPMQSMVGLRPLLPKGQTMDKDPVEAKKVVRTIGEAYGLFYDVKKGAADTDFYVDYKINNPWDVKDPDARVKGRLKGVHTENYKPHLYSENSWPEKGDVGVRHHVVGQTGYEAFLAEMPAQYEHGWEGDITKPTYEWERMPCLILRHDPENETDETTFVVIHEPYYQTTHIRNVTRLNVGNPNVLALQIKFADRTDTFIYSLTGEPVEIDKPDLKFSGTMGVVAMADTGETDAYLIAGEALTLPNSGVQLKNKSALYTGRVTHNTRKWDNQDTHNTFVVESDQELPKGDALRGQQLILEHHGGYMTYAKKRLDSWVLDIEGGTNAQGLNPKALWERWLKESRGENPKLTREEHAPVSYAFEISHVEHQDGKNVIHVTRDPGYTVTDGKVKEDFFPFRKIRGPSTFKIKTSLATQTRPIVSPAGADFLGNVTVTCQVPDSHHVLEYALTDPAEHPTTDAWQRYHKALVIDRDVDLHIRAASENTIREPEVQTYMYRSALKPVNVLGLKKGLVRKSQMGDKYEDQAPQVDVTQGVDAKSFIDAVSKRSGMKTISSPGKLSFEGFIQIDEPGVYTFHYLADSDGMLKIGDRTLSGKRSVKQVRPVSRVVSVALEAGTYPFYCDLEIYKNGRGSTGWWGAQMRLDWEGPDFARTTVPAAQFLYKESQ